MSYQTISLSSDITAITGSSGWTTYDSSTHTDGFKVNNESGLVVVLVRNAFGADTAENEVRVFDSGLVDSNTGANAGVYKRITGITNFPTMIGPFIPAEYNDINDAIIFTQPVTAYPIAVAAVTLGVID